MKKFVPRAEDPSADKRGPVERGLVESVGQLLRDNAGTWMALAERKSTGLSGRLRKKYPGKEYEFTCRTVAEDGQKWYRFYGRYSPDAAKAGGE